MPLKLKTQKVVRPEYLNYLRRIVDIKNMAESEVRVGRFE